MTEPPSPVDGGPPRNPGASRRLRGLLAGDALSVDLVSAYSGDRPLTGEEEERIGDLVANRGAHFHSDLLYAITHQFFPPESARELWEAILRHKFAISRKLKRNVQIIVATLDYLTNLTGDMTLPTIVGEAHIAEIVNFSMRDGLTGLLNHSSFKEILEVELKSHKRHEKAVSLILVDIDDFKAVNDRNGHQEGDRVLRDMARSIRQSARESDICFRYGGEEFAVILPLTDVGEAEQVAERIRSDALEVRLDGRSVTLSLGVAGLAGSDATLKSLVDEADRALYRAKREGKNRVAVWNGSGPT